MLAEIIKPKIGIQGIYTNSVEKKFARRNYHAENGNTENGNTELGYNTTKIEQRPLQDFL